jgi:hypothetical protein
MGRKYNRCGGEVDRRDGHLTSEFCFTRAQSVLLNDRSCVGPHSSLVCSASVFAGTKGFEHCYIFREMPIPWALLD